MEAANNDRKLNEMIWYFGELKVIPIDPLFNVFPQVDFVALHLTTNEQATKV